MTRRLAAVAVASVVVLAGCGGTVSPREELRRDVRSITLAANAGDAQGLRNEVDRLLTTVRDQQRSGDLSVPEAQRLTDLAATIAEQADLIDRELLEEQAEEERRRAEAEASAEAERERRRQEAEASASAEAERERQRQEEERRREEEEGDDDVVAPNGQVPPSPQSQPLPPTATPGPAPEAGSARLQPSSPPTVAPDPVAAG